MTVADNILNRKSAESFVYAWLDVGKEDFRKLNLHSRMIALKLLHDRFADKLHMPCGPETAKQINDEKEEKKRRMKPEVKDALEQCENILSMCEDVPERGEEFADSVAAGVREVAETIEEQNRVTPDQQRALDNWESGISAWIR